MIIIIIIIIIFIMIIIIIIIIIMIIINIISVPFQLPYHPEVALAAQLIIGLGNTHACAPSGFVHRSLRRGSIIIIMTVITNTNNMICLLIRRHARTDGASARPGGRPSGGASGHGRGRRTTRTGRQGYYMLICQNR